MEIKNIKEKFNIKILCKTHQSEIGGVCDNYECQNKIQIMCAKCVADSNSCIRKNKHNFIPCVEFINGFFETEYQGLIKDYNYSKEILNINNYLKNSETIINNFRNKVDKINSAVTEIYQNMMNKVNELFEDFNSHFHALMQEKENILKQSIENLDYIINYEYLCNLNSDKLKEKLSKMPYDNFNSAIMTMKKTILNLKNKIHNKDEGKISYLININDNIIQKYKQMHDDFQTEITKMNVFLKNSLNEEVFKQVKEEKKTLKDLKILYDSQ